MSIRSGVWLYAWSDRPEPHALDTFAGALVRAANGDGTVSGTSGYDFAASWRAWNAMFPGRCQPWTYVYPDSHGDRTARALFGVTGPQPVYQFDLEETVPPATIRLLCATMRGLAPDAVLVFDSYPSRRQFGSVNGAGALDTFDTAIAEFDAYNPQVYYATQSHYDADADGIPDYLDDAKGKPVLPAISVSGGARPPSWPDVFSSGAAQGLLDRFGTLALWRYPDSDAVKGILTTYHGDDDMTPEEMDALLDRRFPDPAGVGKTSITDRIAERTRQSIAANTTYGLDVLRRKIDAVAGAVGAQADDERVILAAIATDQATVALTDAQVAELVAQFPQVDPGRIADAVRLDLSQALAT